MFQGLDKDQYDRQYGDNYLLNRLWSYLSQRKRWVVIVVSGSLAVSFSLALIPIFISLAVEALEEDHDDVRLMLLIGALFFTALIQYTSNWVRRRTMSRLVGYLTSEMRKDAFESAVRRDLAFYDENKSGKVLSRITNDTEEFGQSLVLSSDLVSEFVQMVFLFALLFSRHVQLTLLLVVFLFPVVGITYVFRILARRVTRKGFRAMANVNDTIQETVTGISVAKNFRQEAMIYDEFVNVNRQSYQVNLQRGRVMAAIFPVLNGTAGFAIAAMFYFGAKEVVSGAIGVSLWYLYIQSVDRFWFPVMNLSSYWSQFQQSMSALERIFALIDAPNTVKQTDDKPIDVIGRIEFKQVNFGYKADQPVLQNFSLDIKPGQSIAFVGHTGAGKSTIAKLIMRLYEFQKGQICIDGQDIRSLNMHSYRSQLGFVPQTPFLFSGTIMDNIRYGKPNATDAEIETMAKRIGHGEWMETLPNGLYSDVGERGSRLSIGQRQLVSLMRVLVQKPAIFILDEATASVDNFTESQIQEALDLILAQSTSILIAHRLSTVRSADRIIVLKEGRMIEEGNHKELMTQGGHYAELYNTYFRHQSLTYVETSRSRLAAD